MSYQDLPDARPIGVRLAIGRLPKWAAIAIAGLFAAACAGGVAGMILDQEHLVIWGIVAIVGLLATGHYIAAIRWTDNNKAWRRHRSRHRHRELF